MTPGHAGPQSGREIEAKFCVRSLRRLEQRLLEMGARLVEPRVLELNFRFDDPQRSLKAHGSVLRLRKDAGAWLTYKGAPEPGAGITNRSELEVSVSDLDTARHILEALGFMQTAVYEKYRTVYEVHGCKVMLDELPYGNFIEIEGSGIEPIREVAGRLRIRWEAAVRTSYLGLWERYRSGRSMPAGRLTFAALAGLTFRPEDLGVKYGDEQDAGAAAG